MLEFVLPVTAHIEYMIERLSQMEKVRNLYEQTCLLHLKGGRVDQALRVVSEQAGKIGKPDQFHLGGGQWVDGIKLGNLRLSAGRTRPAMIVTTGVFDITNRAFRFGEALKPITRLVEGIRVAGLELEGQIDQGHETFFLRGTREQQRMLLSETLAAIFSIREAETGMPKV